MTAPISDQLANIVEPRSVLSGAQVVEYAIDGVVPEAVVCPENRAQVIEILRWASAGKATVFPRGGGTRQGLGNMPERVDLVLDLRRFNRVLDYQPADMTVTTEAGITVSALQQELAAGGMFLPLEAPVASRATIGGTLSVAGSGPLAFAYGPPRDWLIGIGVVSAAGVETKSGGKVVKNVTGYDLNKLYTGSLGTLGVIVEATFKVSPQAPESGALLASFPTLEMSIEAGRKLIGSAAGPIGYLCASRGVSRRFQKLPGGALSQQLELSDSNPCIAFAFYSGRPRATKRRMDESAAELENAGATAVTSLESTQAPQVLEWVTDLGWSAATRPILAFKVSVPPQAVLGVAAELQNVNLNSGPPDIAADPGFGTVRIFWWKDKPDETGGQSCLDAISAVRQVARDNDGTAIVEHCPAEIKTHIDVWGEEPEGMEIMRRIKSKFDPDGILNPGRFLGRL